MYQNTQLEMMYQDKDERKQGSQRLCYQAWSLACSGGRGYAFGCDTIVMSIVFELYYSGLRFRSIKIIPIFIADSFFFPTFAAVLTIH